MIRFPAFSNIHIMNYIKKTCFYPFTLLRLQKDTS